LYHRVEALVMIWRVDINIWEFEAGNMPDLLAPNHPTHASPRPPQNFQRHTDKVSTQHDITEKNFIW